MRCRWWLLMWFSASLVWLAGCGSNSGSGCAQGQIRCAGECVNPAQDRNNCGVCGNVCFPGQFCTIGTCTACDNECNLSQRRCTPDNRFQYQQCDDHDGDTCFEWGVYYECPGNQMCHKGECIPSDCTDECFVRDQQRCDIQGASSYQICSDFDDDPCLEWGELYSCQADQICMGGQCITATCQHECKENEFVCADPPANGVLSCADHDSDGCMDWGGFVPCGQNETCSGSGVCSQSCQDDCAIGEKKCNGNGYQTCGSFDADACLDWSGITDCASYEECFNGVCQVACTNDCQENEKRCSGSDVNEGFDVCDLFDADPCLDWGGHVVCDSGQKCENGNCVEDCVDECPTLGKRECSAQGAGFVVCRNDVDADSCLEWTPETLCQNDQTCISGQCSETCQSECTQGDRECYLSGYRACVAHATQANCWVWSEVTACGQFEVCNPASAQCVLNCTDECSQSGALGCSDDLSGYRECRADWDADPCLEWGENNPCGAAMVCEAVSVQCVPDCEDLCSGSGDLRCTADGLGYEICADYNDDSCLEWGGYTDCPQDQTCSNGTCSVECSDECDIPNEVVCSQDDPNQKTFRICGDYDSDVCLELSSPSICDYGYTCQPGGCTFVCSDSCSGLNERRCNSLDIELCAEQDGDECLEWGVTQTCDSASQLCYKANCISKDPPTTILINEILYNWASDVSGSDTQPDNQLFIELVGVAGQQLDNYSIVGVNGNPNVDGDYVEISLDGLQIPSDGHLLIVHPAADPALLAKADLVTNKVDLQNGPDNVQVRWAGSVVVDALAYGQFTEFDRFAGEGQAYTDSAPEADPGGGMNYCLSRGVDHFDSGINRHDFYRRTFNNCSPGEAGPGAILFEFPVYGGLSTPSVDHYGNIWSIDVDGLLNVVYPTIDGGYFYLLDVDTYFLSSVAVAPPSGTPDEPVQLYIGSNKGLYGYSVTVNPTPYAVDVQQNFGPVETSAAVFSTPAISTNDGSVFFGTYLSGFFGYNADGSRRFWYDTQSKSVLSSPALAQTPQGEVVIFGLGDDTSGEVVALYTSGAQAGTIAWKIEGIAGACHSSPAVSNGIVYCGCDTGRLYAFSVIDGQPPPTFGQGLPLQDWGVNIAQGGAQEVEGCSPVATISAAGDALIGMTSRSGTGNLYLLRDDGASVEGMYWDLIGADDMLMSSPALGQDESVTVHAGVWLVNYSMDGSLQWYAQVGDTYPADAWIHPSPTWVRMPNGQHVVLVVDSNFDFMGGRLYAIQASVGPADVAGSYPLFHGDSQNSGNGY